MRRLWLVLHMVTVATHLPFAVAVGFAAAVAGLRADRAAALGAIAGLAGVLLLGGRLRHAVSDRPVSAARLALVEEPYYAHWCAALLALPLSALAALGVLAHAAIAGSGGLAWRLGGAALGSYLGALAVCAYGVFVRRRWVRVRELEVEVPGLAPAFEGYRVAHLSDLHIGGLWPRQRAERWASRVRALEADLVALTGDYVTHGGAFHDDIAAVLSTMRGRDGSVAVLGNHDYFGDAEPLVQKLRAAGVRVLRNERTQIERGGDALVIAGVDDTWSRCADVARAMRGAPLLALAHDPQLFPALAAAGARVVLAGHTHWGQVGVPFLITRWNLSAISYRYHAGSYLRDGAQLFVSPGLGTTGPPIRLGAPPEITVLKLKRKA